MTSSPSGDARGSPPCGHRRLAAAIFALLALASPAVEAAGASADALDTKARRLFEDGDFAGAIALWKRAYDADPVPAFLMSVSTCYGRLGDLEAAVDYAERYLKTPAESDDPSRRAKAKERAAELHRLAGQEATVKGDCEAALRHFERARALARPADALVLSGICLERLDRRSEARASFAEALRTAGELDGELADIARARLKALDPAPKPARGRWLLAGGAAGAVVLGVAAVILIAAWPRPDPAFDRSVTLGEVRVRF